MIYSVWLWTLLKFNSVQKRIAKSVFNIPKGTAKELSAESLFACRCFPLKKGIVSS